MDKTLVKYVLIVLILLVVVWVVRSSSENFNVQQNELSSSVPHINPLMYEPKLSLLTSASDFVGLPDVVIPPWAPNGANYGVTDTLMDNKMGNAGLEFNLCSKSCCSAQYPTPFGVNPDPLLCGSKGEFQPSSYSCNNGWQDSGCLCMTKEQSKFLGSRGNNA